MQSVLNAATDSGHDFRPHVATDGAGHWVAVWESEDTLGGAVGPDADIFVARSKDSGATWTAPVPLNSAAATDLGDDGRPQVVTDGAGTWLVVWHDEDPMGGPGGKDADILVARSTDDGASWTAPVPLHADAATDADYDLNPIVASDRAGHWLAAWVFDDSWRKAGGTDVDLRGALSMDAGASWTAPAALNANAATDAVNDEALDLASDGAGHWVAVWQSNQTSRAGVATTFQIVVARSSDAGASWSAPTPLAPAPAIPPSPHGQRP